MYPSEYAYQRNSVYGSERSGANCRPYASDLQTNDYTERYTHCDGTQLRLTDSDFGSEQYSSSDYYVWNAGPSGHQLLFIFLTRVNLTTITLHYYSDSVRGLPRLRFFAVPDDFDVWDALLGSYSSVDIAAVTPGVEPAGRRNFSVNVDFVNAKKILMYKFSSSFILSVSEVKFFTCSFPETPTTMTTTTANTAYSESSWTAVPHSLTDQLDEITTTTVKLQTSSASTTTITSQSSWHM